MKATFTLGGFLSARSVFGDTLVELGQKHKNVWAITSDISSALKPFKKECPDRYIDVGIAEQNLAGIAAGLALEGNIPFICGMIPFMVMRACEQNRTAICYQDLPVRLIGTGGGLGGAGSTHNAMEDIGIMKSMVNMTVLSIGDPNMVRDMMHLSIDYPHPMFLRLAAGKKDRMLYEPGKHTYRIGVGLTAREGGDATIIAHGAMVFEALEAAKLLAAEGINTRIVDMFCIKPLDKEILFKAVTETKHILVLEDHLMDCGLASTIADAFADEGIYPKKFKRLGIPQVYAGFGGEDALHKKYGYDKTAAAAAVKNMLTASSERSFKKSASL